MIAAVAIALALAAESLVVYAWAEWIATAYAEPAHAVSAALFVVVGLVAFALPRAIGWYGLAGRPAGAVYALITYVTFYGALRIAFAGDFALWDFAWVGDFVTDAEGITRAGGEALMGAILLLFVWLRSSWRANVGIEIETLARPLGFAFFAATAVVIIGAGSDRIPMVARAVMAFYGTGIMALALSQLAMSGATLGSVRAGGITATLLGATAAATVVGVLVFGVLFAAVGDELESVLTTVLVHVLTVVLTPIAWVMSWIFGLLFSGVEPFEQIQDMPRETLEPGDLEDRTGPQRTLLYGGRMLLLLGVVAVGVVLVVIVTRLRRRMRAAVESTVESASSGSLGEDLRAGLRSLFSRRRGDVEPGGEGVVRLYAEVLQRAERQGHPRQPAQTPEEYVPVLSQTFHDPVTTDITTAFEEARYAGRPPDARTLEALERRWRSLEP